MPPIPPFRGAISTTIDLDPSKIQWTTDHVSCDSSLLDTQGFFGVREKWVLLVISWIG